MASPISRFVPVNTKLNHKQWVALNSTLRNDLKILGKLKRGMIEDSLWYMERIQYFRELKKNNLDYVLGSLLNDKDYEAFHSFN